jgi:hypothetical protein
MYQDVVRRLGRVSSIAACVGGAAWIIWRGNTFADSRRVPVYIQLMCITLGLLLALTAVAIGVAEPEPDESGDE